MAIQSRTFESESDYARMRQLLIDGFAISGAPAYSTGCFTIGDLDWWRWTANPDGGIQNAQLWFDGDELMGFTWPGVGEVDLISHPNHREVEPLMLEWAEKQPLARSVDEHERTGIRAWSYGGDSERVATLRRFGYERTAEGYCFRQRADLTDVPSPKLPEGFRIRNVEGEADLERRVDVHRDAFSPSKMTVEKHRNVMRSLTYRSELDLVVEAPDGSFAAYCLVWFDEPNHFGLFEPVGCHSDYRKRGLTTAVMYEGMRRMRELGATRAFVNNKLGEPAATALYESIGMPVLDVAHAWIKPLA